MRPGLTAIAALTAALVLSSCSSTEGGPAPAVNPSETATVKADSTPSPAAESKTAEDIYLGQLRKAFDTLETAPDGDLVGIGQGICTMYDNGGTTDEVNSFLATDGDASYAPSELGGMHGAAVAAFCPEYLGMLTR